MKRTPLRIEPISTYFERYRRGPNLKSVHPVVVAGELVYVSGLPPFDPAPQDFRYTSGEPRKFSRSDLESPVTREFCGECGTHLTTRRPGLPLVVLKVGTLDDPSLFGTPHMAIYTVDKQPFHVIPDGLQTFERLPPR